MYYIYADVAQLVLVFRDPFKITRRFFFSPVHVWSRISVKNVMFRTQP